MNIFPIHRAVTDCPDGKDSCRHACTTVCKRLRPEALQMRVVKLGLLVHTFYECGMWHAYDHRTYDDGGRAHLGTGTTELKAVEELLDKWEDA